MSGIAGRSRHAAIAILATMTIAIIGSIGAAPARSDAGSGATLVENVHGYTLAGDELRKFSGLVFALGKVVTVGDAATLRGRYPTAHLIDGQGKILLPGLIDAHSHVIDLGFEQVQVRLFGISPRVRASPGVRIFPSKTRIRFSGCIPPSLEWIITAGPGAVGIPNSV